MNVPPVTDRGEIYGEIGLWDAWLAGYCSRDADFVALTLERDDLYDRLYNSPEHIERRNQRQIQDAFAAAAETAEREHLDDRALLQLQVELVVQAALPPHRPDAAA